MNKEEINKAMAKVAGLDINRNHIGKEYYADIVFGHYAIDEERSTIFFIGDMSDHELDVWNPTQDMNHVMACVEMMQEEDWAFNITCSWQVEIYKHKGECFCERDDDLAMAFCKAILKAKGIKVE